MTNTLTDHTPFADLPAALVEEVLGQTAALADDLLASFERVRAARTELRNQLVDSGHVMSESNLPDTALPTTCGADGSYAIERLLTTDLAAAAAVAVEGLTPPSEERHWDTPHHKTFVAAEPHVEDTATVLRAVMIGEELSLATTAPHQVVMFDGTLTLPIIYFNQAINKAPAVPQLRCAKEFVERCPAYLDAYFSLLRSEQPNKHYIALPKYSTRREIGTELGWPSSHDDRGILTLLLDAGELTKPIPLEQPRDQQGQITWHLNTDALPNDVRKHAYELANEIVSALQGVQVFYYKPHDWLPALRVEAATSVTDDPHRLAQVVRGLKHQTATPSMLEPYPIYLADRTVKALARAIPAVRQVTTQRVSEQYGGNIGEVFFALHGYRSEAGR